MIRTVLTIGNSLTGGAHSTNMGMSYVARLKKMLEDNHPEYDWRFLATEQAGSIPRFGGLYLNWERFRKSRPDIVCIQQGENDGTQPTTELAVGISPLENNLTAATSFSSDNRLLRLYNPSDPSVYEYVVATSISGTNSPLTIRGALGTIPRSWPAGTPFATWGARNEEFIRTYTDLLEYIVGDQRNYPLFVIGGFWFGETMGGELKAWIDSKIARGHRNIAYARFLNENGEYIGSENPVGDTYQGPAARLTAGINNSVTAIPVTRPEQFSIGDHVLITHPSSSPTSGNSEVVRITAVNIGTGTLTVTRGQLGSTAKSFTDGNERVCKMAVASMNPRKFWHSLGGANFSSSDWGIDRHPNDLGHYFIARSMYQGIDSLLR